MTHEDLEKRLTDLVQAAREGGLSDEAVIEVLFGSRGSVAGGPDVGIPAVVGASRDGAFMMTNPDAWRCCTSRSAVILAHGVVRVMDPPVGPDIAARTTRLWRLHRPWRDAGKERRLSFVLPSRTGSERFKEHKSADQPAALILSVSRTAFLDQPSFPGGTSGRNSRYSRNPARFSSAGS